MNLLLGAAVNYAPEQLKNYILSFRKFNSSDDIVILTDDKSKQSLEEYYSDFNVKFVVSDFLKYDMPIHNSRIFISLEFLQNNSQYSNVLITDTRDVVFQSDPFQNLLDNFLYVFEEDSHVSIEKEYNNALWIEAIYGEDSYQEIAKENILCVGTLLASRNRMIELLQLMSDHINQIEPGVLKHLYVDQAVLNHIVRTNKIICEVKKNGDIVATVAISVALLEADPYDLVTLRIRDKKLVVQNHIPSVIHQYDRDFTLSQLYDTMYDERDMFQYQGNVNA